MALVETATLTGNMTIIIIMKIIIIIIIIMGVISTIM